VRSGFNIEGGKRMAFPARHPPTRVWRSARRLHMMHLYGWNGRWGQVIRPIAGLSGSVEHRHFPEDFDWLPR
jgi:hypothetical protein